MYLHWNLLANLAGVIYPFRRIRRSTERDLENGISSGQTHSSEFRTVPESSTAETREMKWIQFEEFLPILETTKDLIVIDLRPDARWHPFSIRDVLVLPVAMNELIETLECLPSDRSVAFVGATSLCIFLISTSSCMRGSAPLYVLEADPGYKEAS
jgi:hypothetical protein